MSLQLTVITALSEDESLIPSIYVGLLTTASNCTPEDLLPSLLLLVTLIMDKVTQTCKKYT